tara:strand:+ start:6179 stop:6571 length:393 start_codon:yes stop_codon:yes gene_type:complete
MKWKTILKAPMPLDSRVKRNEDYKQAIIAYEKNTIEPKLTEYVQSSPALENLPIFIIFLDNNSYHERVYTNNKHNEIRFAIHLPSSPELGMNMRYIVDTIGELYANEGYTVDTKKSHGDNPALRIEQPNQ